MRLDSHSTLASIFLQRIALTPDSLAYRQPEGDGFRDMTWREVGSAVGRWADALRRENLAPGDRVGIVCRNRIEWVLFDQAAIQCGLVTVPLYCDDRPDNMAHCLNDAGVGLIVVEDGVFWAKLIGHVKTVHRVVCLSNAPANDPRVVPIERWLPSAGRPLETPATDAGDLATIVYTSGTTGRPKGVMLTHRNIVSNVGAIAQWVPIHATDRLVSFLPLSHMFERTCGYYYASVYSGACTVYARSIQTLAEDIQKSSPTVLVAVPRIFERIYQRMREQTPPGSLKGRLFDAAVACGWRRFQGKSRPADRYFWPVLRHLVADKLHKRLGGRIRLIIVGGAAFAQEHARVFLGLGLPIIQGFGLTETSPVLAANRPGDNDPASVGHAIPGVELAIGDGGELLARGDCVMSGYWQNEAATRAMIDEAGWLHTGDIARIDDGRVYITGRIKEIIVLSNGEKVPPGDVEQAILCDTDFEQVMLVGEGKPHLGLLCVTKLENPKEICTRANARLDAFPGYARIRHIARVEGPWAVDNGLLTPTLKLKRKEMERRYASEIAAMYGDEPCP